MLAEWSELARKHWVVGGIVASLLWFYAGQQYVSKKQLDTALLWQCVAVMLILILSGWTIAEKEWLGLACGVVVLYVEVRSIRQILREQAATPSNV